MILQASTQTLTAQAGSNPGANVPVLVEFEELLRGQPSDGRSAQSASSQMATGGTTKVTILAAPTDARMRRVPRRIQFKNVSASTIGYTFRWEDTAATVTAVIVMTVSLLTGECGEWTLDDGWKFFSTSGNVK